MKLGDFTGLAKAYVNRPGYSDSILDILLSFAQKSAQKTRNQDNFTFVDVGAGTGKLTEQLVAREIRGFAVEPNQDMRVEGEKYCPSTQVQWLQGSGESTPLPDNSANWITMASSFHWTDHHKSLPEFKRLLRPNGLFTALWNPRNIASSPLHQSIENSIYSIVPDLKRVSSGSSVHMDGIEKKLLETGDFSDLVYMQAEHTVSMSRERYLGAWRSVNDIQAQAGPDRFQKIMNAIENQITGMSEIVVPYITRSWTVKVIK